MYERTPVNRYFETMKILISCYACSPYRGSEPGMGWHFVHGLSHKNHELYVITEQEKWEEDITKYQEEHPDELQNVHFYFIRKKRARILRKIWPPSYYWFYRNWQKNAYRLACKLEQQINFDLVHQLNMVGYREPGYLWKMNKPFVWGPIGGFNLTPLSCLSPIDFHSIVFLGGRNIINFLQMKFLKRPKLAAQKAGMILSATSETAEIVRKCWRKESIIMPEVGYDKIDTLATNAYNEVPILSICWAGELIVRKALDLLLLAIATSANREKINLTVLGDGLCRKRWQKMSKSLNIDHIVRFCGKVPLNEAHKRIAESDVFCITSLSDLTSTVLLESLSLGVPVIAPEHCGFRDVITEDCGFLIPVTNRKNLISALSKKLDEIVTDKRMLKTMKVGAISRAAEYSWKEKISKLDQIYRKVSENENSSNS